MKSPYFNKDWTLAIQCKWVPKEGIQPTLLCEACKGQGSYYPMMSMDDEATDCSTCLGRGYIDNPEVDDKPEMPRQFRMQMVAAMNGWLTKMKEKAGTIE